MQHKIQEVKESVGVVVGGSTASFAIFNDVANVAEQIGMIAGCMLTLWLLGDKVYRTFIKTPTKE